MRRGDEQLRVHGRHVLSVDDGNAYWVAGVTGLGVLWLPQYMARAPLSRGELLPLFVTCASHLPNSPTERAHAASADTSSV